MGWSTTCKVFQLSAKKIHKEEVLKTEGQICDYCHTDPGAKRHSETMWNGFRDADTDQLVCFKCQSKHYVTKFKKPELIGLHSEFPVIIRPAQLPINFGMKSA
jgi:hypothetical protein